MMRLPWFRYLTPDSVEEAVAILDGFSSMNLDTSIITKWDETSVPGEALSFLIEQGMSITQITNGQRVPEDIVTACPASLADLMFSLTDEADEEPQ